MTGIPANSATTTNSSGQYSLEQASDLAKKLSTSLHDFTPVNLEFRSPGTFLFHINLSSYHLAGFSDPVPVLLLSAHHPDQQAEVADFWKEYGNRDTFLIFLFTSPEAYRAVQHLIPPGRRLILLPTDWSSLLASKDAADTFRHFVLQQVHRLLISPFNILRPATGNMFFGREKELSRLRDDHEQSYILVGPGRTGKSSLLLRYKRESIKRKDQRAIELISFYDCPNSSPDTVAQHLVFRIDWSQKAYNLKASELGSYFKYRRRLRGERIELLLDEVDEVCGSEAFQYLAQSAKDGNIRLVLSGRSSALLNLEFSVKSNASMRLERLYPEPLTDHAAEELIKKPLSDLGINIANCPVVLNHILMMTGRQPHLLQYYGKQLVELTLDKKLTSLDMLAVTEIEKSLEMANFFVSPLTEIKDSRLRTLAAALLKWEQTAPFNCHDGSRYLESKQITIKPEELFRDCNLLVMQNVLSWRGDGFQVASEGLRTFARRAGIIS
jgi:hypothetical protein